MLSWHHSGFNVYCGSAIWPHDEDALEKLARFIIRAAFSQERMIYIHDYQTSDGIAKVIYRSKDGRKEKMFHALDWLARLTTHIPNKREQMARYYGYYSNKARGMRKKAGRDDDIPAVMNSELSSRAANKNWARLIQKIYEVDPLVCPKCRGEMKIIAFIDQQHIIKKILNHLNIRDVHNHGPPPVSTETTAQLVYDDDYSQVPPYDYWTQ